MNRLIIAGAGGHGKVIADIAFQNGYRDIVFLDDNSNIKECAGFPIIGRTAEIVDLQGDKIVAIGNANIREKLLDSIHAITLIHPKAVIARDVEMGEGTVVMAGVVINSGARLGRGCIINTSSSVDHDCKLNHFVHVAVGAHLSGTVCVGEKTWIGTGATISNNISICDECIIGAGAVVIKNIKEKGIYVGVPAKALRS